MRYLPIAALPLLLSCSSSHHLSDASSGQSPHMLTRQVTTTVNVGYLLYLPKDYPGGTRLWPLLVFLHGSGESGTDLEAVKRNGPPKLADEGRDLPFVILSPQRSDGNSWTPSTIRMLIDEVAGECRIDTDRICLTGVSMGGFATWDLALEMPGVFAAIAPVCGGGNPDAVCALRDLPVWVFHGAKDNIVPIESSEQMVTALKACGGNVNFTVYPGVGHNSWDSAYSDPGLYRWLLAQHRQPRSSPGKGR